MAAITYTTKKNKRMFGNAQCSTGNRTGARKANQELLLVACQVGKAAQHGHEQGKNQRSNRFRIAPSNHNRRTRVGDRGKIHGNQRRGKHDEGRIAHIVKNPAQLFFSEPKRHNRYPFVLERTPVWTHHKTHTSIRCIYMGYLKYP